MFNFKNARSACEKLKNGKIINVKELIKFDCWVKALSPERAVELTDEEMKAIEPFIDTGIEIKVSLGRELDITLRRMFRFHNMVLDGHNYVEIPKNKDDRIFDLVLLREIIDIAEISNTTEELRQQ